MISLFYSVARWKTYFLKFFLVKLRDPAVGAVSAVRSNLTSFTSAGKRFVDFAQRFRQILDLLDDHVTTFLAHPFQVVVT